MLFRLDYLSVTDAFALLRLIPIGGRNEDVEILALRHRNTVLERRLGDARPRFSPATGHSSRSCWTDSRCKRFVGSAYRYARRRCRGGTATSSIAATPPNPAPRALKRPRTVRSIRLLLLRLARVNPRLGYRRIHGELLKPGRWVAASTVRRVLKCLRIPPAPQRDTGTSWRRFLRAQVASLPACDFFHVDRIATLKRVHAFFVVEVITRYVHILGTTTNPDGPRTTQQARNLLMEPGDRADDFRFPVRDPAGQFTAPLDAILDDAGIDVVKTHHGVHGPTPTPSGSSGPSDAKSPSTTPSPATRTTATGPADRRAGLHVDASPTSPRRPHQRIRDHGRPTTGRTTWPTSGTPQALQASRHPCSSMSKMTSRAARGSGSAPARSGTVRT
ncbi:hypothetical protein GCM10018963_74080 [Saccharothrix longispora]